MYAIYAYFDPPNHPNVDIWHTWSVWDRGGRFFINRRPHGALCANSGTRSLVEFNPYSLRHCCPIHRRKKLTNVSNPRRFTQELGDSPRNWDSDGTNDPKFGALYGPHVKDILG